jgi:hypothetical protein
MSQPDPFLTFAMAMMEELDELAWMASFVDSLFFDMLLLCQEQKVTGSKITHMKLTSHIGKMEHNNLRHVQ